MPQPTITYRGYGGNGATDARVRRGYAAYTGLPQPVSPGFQYEMAGVAPYTGSGFSAWQGASPAVGIGDVGIFPLLSSPSAFVVVPNPDGTFEILSAGDRSRQSVLFSLYRISSNAIDGPEILWDWERAPIWGALPISITVTINQPIDSISLFSGVYAASSPSGDALSYSLASGAFPPGVSVSSGGILSGTPVSGGTYNFSINATDLTGTSTASPLAQIVVVTTEVVPTLVGLDILAALALISARSLAQGAISSSFGPVTLNQVTAQQPSPGSVVSIGTPVSLTISGGVPSTVGFRVAAVTLGNYNGEMRFPGDVFDLNFAQDFSDASVNYGPQSGEIQLGWMKQVDQNTPLLSSVEQGGILPVADPLRRTVY